ncbi:MAG: glycosyltransferase family 2 protein [Actinomycetota bacterium]
MNHSASPPKISVIVPTYNRALRLPALVASLEAQDTDAAFEVVIVDDGSSDETPTVLAELERRSPAALHVVRCDANKGPAAARNRGWRAASSAYVVFTDDDCTPQPGWLRAMLAALADHCFVQGRTQPDPSQIDRAGAFRRTVDVGGENGFYETCNMAYRRDVLEQLGGFDETFPLAAGEDTDLGCRARGRSFRFAFAPDAVVYHDVVDQGFVGYVRNTKRWAGVVRVVRRHPHLRRFFLRGPFWLPRQYLVVVSAIGFAVAIGVQRQPASAIVAVMGVLPYATYRLGVSPLAAKGWRRVATVPAAFIADVAEVGTHVASVLRPGGR